MHSLDIATHATCKYIRINYYVKINPVDDDESLALAARFYTMHEIHFAESQLVVCYPQWSIITSHPFYDAKEKLLLWCAANETTEQRRIYWSVESGADTQHSTMQQKKKQYQINPTAVKQNAILWCLERIYQQLHEKWVNRMRRKRIFGISLKIWKWISE